MRNLFRGIVVVLVAAVFCTCSAFAESVNLEGMTTEQLYDLLDDVRLKLMQVDDTYTDSDVVILDEHGVKVTITGWEIKPMGVVTEEKMLWINVTIENGTDNDVNVSAADIAINGWKVSNTSAGKVVAGTRAKTHFGIDYVNSKAEVESLDQLEDIAFTIKVSNSETYQVYFEEDVRLMLNMTTPARGAF